MPLENYIPQICHYVRITTKSRPKNWNKNMDKFKGKIVQITRVSWDRIYFEGDQDYYWGYYSGHFQLLGELYHPIMNNIEIY